MWSLGGHCLTGLSSGGTIGSLLIIEAWVEMSGLNFTLPSCGFCGLWQRFVCKSSYSELVIVFSLGLGV
jgi:hypothetical protein